MKVDIKTYFFHLTYKYLFLSSLLLLSIISPAKAQERLVVSPQYLPLEANFCLLNGECVYLEVAESPREQRLGLMLRNSLPRLRGMYFPFNSSRKAKFWMYKTLSSLDMFFLSGETVVSIIHDVPTCEFLPCKTYGPENVVDSVIETAAGEANRLKIKIGDRIIINRIKPKLNNDHLSIP